MLHCHLLYSSLRKTPSCPSTKPCSREWAALRLTSPSGTCWFIFLTFTCNVKRKITWIIAWKAQGLIFQLCWDGVWFTPCAFWIGWLHVQHHGSSCHWSDIERSDMVLSRGLLLTRLMKCRNDNDNLYHTLGALWITLWINEGLQWVSHFPVAWHTSLKKKILNKNYRVPGQVPGLGSRHSAGNMEGWSCIAASEIFCLAAHNVKPALVVVNAY